MKSLTLILFVSLLVTAIRAADNTDEFLITPTLEQFGAKLISQGGRFDSNDANFHSTIVASIQFPVPPHESELDRLAEAILGSFGRRFGDEGSQQHGRKSTVAGLGDSGSSRLYHNKINTKGKSGAITTIITRLNEQSSVAYLSVSIEEEK